MNVVTKFRAYSRQPKRLILAVLATVLIGAGILISLHHAGGTEVTYGSNLSDPATKQRAASVISSFENSTTDLQYGYIENIGDGRGYTAGRAGLPQARGTCWQLSRNMASWHRRTV